MDKAVLKTLAYADIFNYPLKVWEIHKWLIGKKASLRQVEKAIKKLDREARVKQQGYFYFLSGRKGLAQRRLAREKHSAVLLTQARLISQLFKLIPWIKLVGISGSLAVNNAGQKDDIDLLIITASNRLWLTRIFSLALLTLLNKRRKRADQKQDAAGKVCINILLEDGRLAQQKRNIYVAHEVLQMKVLWQRDRVYSRYLEDNGWAFKFLPNWIAELALSDINYNRYGPKKDQPVPLFDKMERLARRYQLFYMGGPSGSEQISEGAVYFHPKDLSPQVVDRFSLALKRLSGST